MEGVAGRLVGQHPLPRPLQRLLERRDVFRRQVSADVQMQRYKDMAFRIFRSDALQKYRAQFDLAARDAYLAAKAYDYETTLLESGFKFHNPNVTEACGCGESIKFD